MGIKNINDQVSDRLKSRGCLRAIAYALPKVHKPDLQWRIIVSFIGSPTYNLASF